MAGMLAKMNVWLPGLQCAAAGLVNAVTVLIDSTLGDSFGSRDVRARTCAGEVSGVVAAGGVGIAGLDGGDEEGENC